MLSTRTRAITALLLTALMPLLAGGAPSPNGTPRLMQGPLIGPVTPHEIPVWVRLNEEWWVSIEYGTDPALDPASGVRVAGPVQAKEAADRTAVVTLTGLEPDTVYYYRVLVGTDEDSGRPDPYLRDAMPFRVKTAPAGNARFTVCFGSCARVQRDPVQPIWDAVATTQPDFFIWLGDNIYGDTRNPEALAEEYRRQRDVPSLQPINRSIPQPAVWDDHDFGLNDHDKTHPRKADALEVFKQYWPNPAYGLPDVPGVFFRYSYGGVDFFFLDVRYHRDPNAMPDGPDKTMLGKEQLQWLKEGLAESQAPFKVLVSGTGWSKAKGPQGDSWAAFLHERNDLLAHIRDRAIPGVILISGDVHHGEFNAIPAEVWGGGYDLYELVSSPLAQPVSRGSANRQPERRVRDSYHEKTNVGLLRFDLTGAEPTVELNLLDTQGAPVWEPVILKASDLQP